MNNNLEELITALYDMIQDAKSVPLSSDKCIIERDKALDMLDDLSAQLPSELKQARTIVQSREELVSQARREAEDMIRAAKENAAATMRDLQLEIERETRRLEEAKRLCDQFGQKMQAALTAGSRELEALLQKPADQFRTAAPAAEAAPAPEEFIPEEITEEAANALEGIEVPDFSSKPEGDLETKFFEVEMKAGTGVSEDKLRMFAPKPRFDFSTLQTDKENNEERE